MWVTLTNALRKTKETLPNLSPHECNLVTNCISSNTISEPLSQSIDGSGKLKLTPADIIYPTMRDQLSQQVLLPEERIDPVVEESNLDDPVLTRYNGIFIIARYKV